MPDNRRDLLKSPHLWPWRSMVNRNSADSGTTLVDVSDYMALGVLHYKK